MWLDGIASLSDDVGYSKFLEKGSRHRGDGNSSWHSHIHIPYSKVRGTEADPIDIEPSNGFLVSDTKML